MIIQGRSGDWLFLGACDGADQDRIRVSWQGRGEELELELSREEFDDLVDSVRIHQRCSEVLREVQTTLGRIVAPSTN